MSTTPYMNLTLPTVSSTAGPLYATQNNAAFTLVDSHNHTSGYGVPVPSAGLNINGDLSCGGYNLTTLRSTRYSSQVAPLGLAADLNCVYFSGGNFFVNDGSGNQIQLTTGGALNTASIGGISGLGATTASVVYSNVTKTFTFSQAANTSAYMDCGAITIHENVALANGITIQSPGTLATAYSITLPTGLPASTRLVTLSAAGALATSLTPTVSSITVGSSPIEESGGSLILGSSTGYVYPNGTTGAALYSGNNIRKIDIAAGNGSATHYPIVVSAGNPTYGLQMVAGKVNSAGAKTGGDGFTSVRNAAGSYTITFTQAFDSSDVVFLAMAVNIRNVATGQGASSSTGSVAIFNYLSNAQTDDSFNFIAIGQRGA